MAEFKRITEEESKYYIKLEPGNIDVAVAYTLIQSKDDPKFDEVTYYGESVFDASGAIRKPEWVYVLVNKSIPGICKIGMTTTSVSQRAHEINAATGVITPWFPVFQYKCVNSRYLEREVHQYLQDRGYRVNARREGFEIDSRTAEDVIKTLGEKYLIPREMTEEEEK